MCKGGHSVREKPTKKCPRYTTYDREQRGLSHPLSLKTLLHN